MDIKSQIGMCWMLMSLVACSERANEPSLRRPPSNVTSETVYADFSVDDYRLVLMGISGKCTLIYSSIGAPNSASVKETGIESPCQFVRTGNKLERPQSYIYGRDSSRQTVLLIVGGPPHESVTDRFFPEGCGTRLVRLHLFAERVDLEELVGYYPIGASNLDRAPMCASSMDEVTFAG